MPTSTIVSLLQTTLVLLTGLRGAPQSRVAPAVAQQIVNVAGNAVQLATQAAEPVGFAVTPNDGIWPNARDLTNAPHRDVSGKWVRLGGTVQLMEADTSFGDLNRDGVDDAAVVVKKQMADGSQSYFLAAMLNQGGIMFDVAETPLGANFAPDTATHSITANEAALDGKHYALVGNQLTAQ